jgi:lipopolysaccharide export system permease protein
VNKTIYSAITPYFKMYYATQNYRSKKPFKKLNFKKEGIYAGIDTSAIEMTLSGAKDNARVIFESIDRSATQSSDFVTVITRYMVEYNKKFTLAVSCLVLFFIGAPLGAIIRKGGLGLPVVVSVAFFLIYHVISTVGEKSAKEGNLSPFLGMWLAIIILTPLGLFLTYKATIDSALFDVDIYKNFFKKFFKKKQLDA